MVHQIMAYTLPWDAVDFLIEAALCEDVGKGDLTSEAVVAPDQQARAEIVAKAPGVIAGLPVAERVFRLLQPDIQWQPQVHDGMSVRRGSVVAELAGNARAILKGERTALNFLQRLSGIATLTAECVRRVQNFPVRILDTRKTVPAWRALDKYAVAVGGGTNHRMGLFDGILIKENHVRLVGSVKAAIQRARSRYGDRYPVEIEVRSLEEVKEALEAGADVLLLDNMDVDTLRQAVRMAGGRAKTEASGGISPDTVRDVAATGVDCISIGSLTHSPPALDLALYIK